MTPTLNRQRAAIIKRLRLQRPDWPQHKIAAYLELNQGRVSEVLNGKRFPNVHPAPEIGGLDA